MPIGEEQIAHVARLTRLKLSPSELADYSRELTKRVDYFDRLAAVDTKGIEISSRFITRKMLREDVIHSSLPVEEALKNTSEKRDYYFIVPRVM